MLSRLQRLSEEFNLSVYITNQMTSDPGATMSFVADPKKVWQQTSMLMLR
jgi:meiotic recombination protein DMC1